jgi:hypothetical protein
LYYIVFREQDTVSQNTNNIVLDTEIKKETDTSLPYTTISYEYPTRGPGKDIVLQREKEIIAAWKKENDLSKFSPEELENIGIGPEFGRAYELGIRYSYTQNTKLFSHELEVYSYTGGAHGLTTIETISLDSKNTVIKLADIFINQTSAPAMLKEKLQQKLFTDFAERLYDDPSMVEEGLSGEAFDALVFRASDTGLTFIFGQYQVGPYASGIIEVPFTSVELSEIIRPELLP